MTTQSFSPGLRTTAYLIARAYTALCGAVILLSTLSAFMMPALRYDKGPIPPLSVQLPSLLAVAGCGIALLLPHRLTLRKPLYGLKMALLLLVSAWICYRAADGIWGYLRGQASWHVIPLAGFALALAVAAPTTLWLRQQIFSTPPRD